MHDLIVVGAGFWGTAIAHTARQRGESVLVLDNADKMGASRNAAGIVCWHWYKGPTAEKMSPPWFNQSYVKAGRAFLEEHCELKQTGEIFSMYDAGLASGGRFRKDCSLIPSPDALMRLSNSVQAHVWSIAPVLTGWEVKVKPPGPIPAQQGQMGDMVGLHYSKKLVIAAGAFTDKLLLLSQLPRVNVRSLLGRAMLATLPPNSLVDLSIPRTHAVTPYWHYTLRNFPNGKVRFGDTVDRKNRPDDRNTARLRELIQKLAPGTEESEWLEGYRPVAHNYIVEEVAPNLVVATGGHRVGLGLAGAAARRAMELLYDKG